MTNELHDFEKDNLVVVADGTYCKIQKSKNNDFQYNKVRAHQNRTEILFFDFFVDFSILQVKIHLEM